MDLEKAFSCVPQDVLWYMLEEHGGEGPLLPFEPCIVEVWVQVHQGCTLSPGFRLCFLQMTCYFYRHGTETSISHKNSLQMSVRQNE